MTKEITFNKSEQRRIIASFVITYVFGSASVLVIYSKNLFSMLGMVIVSLFVGTFFTKSYEYIKREGIKEGK